MKIDFSKEYYIKKILDDKKLYLKGITIKLN